MFRIFSHCWLFEKFLGCQTAELSCATANPSIHRLKPKIRCLMPLTSFAEPVGKRKGNA